MRRRHQDSVRFKIQEHVILDYLPTVSSQVSPEKIPRNPQYCYCVLRNTNFEKVRIRICFLLLLDKPKLLRSVEVLTNAYLFINHLSRINIMSELDDSLCIHQLYSPLHAGGLLHNDVLPYDLVGDGPELYAGVLDQLVPPTPDVFPLSHPPSSFPPPLPSPPGLNPRTLPFSRNSNATYNSFLLPTRTYGSAPLTSPAPTPPST